MKINRIVLLGAAAVLSAIVITLFYVHKPQPCIAINTIKTIDSFTQATDVLNKADKNTFVLFDVDDTLIEPSSVVLRSNIKNKDDASWIGELFSTVFANAKHSGDYYLSILQSHEVPLLIEPAIVQTIASLQNRGD